MSNYTVETIDINPGLRIRIEPDIDSESPGEWGNVGKITYRKGSRYVLGTEEVDQERFEEIGRGIESGDLLGLPVCAFVHSGNTIATHPFSCPWDSGRSGWVYCTKKKAIAEFGKKVLTEKVREAALRCLQGEVETFAQYLRGEVYGYIVERVERDEDGDIVDTEHLDSCWGFYGLEYAIEEAKSSAQYHVEQDNAEAVEAGVMAARGIVTEHRV